MKTITKPIIIYVDALRRDLLIASVIQALLKKRGFISFLVSRNTHKSCIKFIKPSLYIIVKNFLKNFEQDIINYIDKSDIFIIDAEGAMTAERCQVHLSQFGLKFKEIIKIVKLAFIWNKSFQDFTVENGAKKNQTIITGSPKIGLSKYINKINKTKPKSNKIGFVGRFSVINNFNKDTALSISLNRYQSYDTFKRGAIGELEVLNIYYNLIEKIIDETDFIISIKPHPNESIQSWDILKNKFGNRIEICKPEIDFLEWMFTVDKIVTTPSTSMVEPLLNQIPIISIHKIMGGSTMHTYYEDMLDGLLESVETPKNENELILSVKKKFTKTSEVKNKTKKTLKDFYNITGDDYSGYNFFDNFFEEIINKYKPSKIHKIVSGYYYLYYAILNYLKFLKASYFRNSNLFDYNYNYFATKKSPIIKRIAKLIDE